MSLFGKRVLCPFCLADIRSFNNVAKCPSCKNQLPIRYVRDYASNQPFFVQVFGWSRVGKTVFLHALTLMLTHMANVWPRYACAAETNPTQEMVKTTNVYWSTGTMPPLTQLSGNETYIMLLHDMERWGGRALITRDCAGEIFDNLEVPVEQAPFLVRAPTAFMFISIPDMAKEPGPMMEMLMNNYINTLLRHDVDLRRQRRQIVIVLTKADAIPNLPRSLDNYLRTDPLWAAVNAPENAPQMDAKAMADYIEAMGRVNSSIREWVDRKMNGRNLIRLADTEGIDLRFSLISSTGGEVSQDNKALVALAPRRVLDPYFWALELQSTT